MKNSLGVGLVGYGYAGRTFHAPLLRHTAGISLKAVCSSQRGQVHTDLAEVEVFPSLEELLVQPEIEAIVIATPNSTHFDLAKRALLAGKHVVVDKPFTVNVAEALELTKLAARLNLVLSVFHNRRWDADFLTVQALIETNCFGQLTNFESHFDRFRPEVKNRWREQSGRGSGLWYDLGPHLLDQALQLFGRPLSLQADFAMQRPHAQTVDYFHVQLRYEKLNVVLHASMLAAEEHARFVLKGTAACYVKYGSDPQEACLKQGGQPGSAAWGVDDREGQLILNGTVGGEGLKVPNKRGNYLQFYQQVRAAIREGGVNPITADETILTMQLLELAETSAKAHSEIIL